MILFISPDTAGTTGILRELDTDVASHHFDDPEPVLASVTQYIEDHRVDSVVIGPELDRPVSERLIGGIADRFAFVGVLAFVEDDPKAMHAAFRLGATDVVSFDADDKEVASLLTGVRRRMEVRRRQGGAGAVDDGPRRRIIATVSPRGGVGRTVVAAGLALTLERKAPGEVVVVDLDLQGGDVAPLLGLTPRLSLGSLAGREEHMGAADIKAALSTDEAGLHVLAAPASLGAAVEVTPDLVMTMIKLLSSSFRYVVIDTGTYLSEPTLAAVDVTTDLMMICAPDVPSVRAIGRANDALDQLAISAPQRHLVINRINERYGMPPRDIEAVTGMEAAAQLRSSKEVALAVNQGSSFHQVMQPRTVFFKSLSPVAGLLAPELDSPTRRLGLRRAS